ncbi:hypothetical protein JVT61DRAFT_11319 [Boletus reticuloceps]|uniref:Uncharacterized protein n=1 Tax=Boletus reticuloceps TaxID=495285 RepID=A0A8I3A5E9_9AGAM|nr:hypothetical protein JVT61DRAFT_11319 [Boletus reticuloceps]
MAISRQGQAASFQPETPISNPTQQSQRITYYRTMSDLADGRYYILPATPSGPPALPIGGLTDKSPSPVVVGGGDRLWTVKRVEEDILHSNLGTIRTTLHRNFRKRHSGGSRAISARMGDQWTQ